MENKTKKDYLEELNEKCITGYSTGGFVIGSLKEDSAEMDFDKIIQHISQVIDEIIDDMPEGRMIRKSPGGTTAIHWTATKTIQQWKEEMKK